MYKTGRKNWRVEKIPPRSRRLSSNLTKGVDASQTSEIQAAANVLHISRSEKQICSRELWSSKQAPVIHRVGTCLKTQIDYATWSRHQIRIEGSDYHSDQTKMYVYPFVWPPSFKCIRH